MTVNKEELMYLYQADMMIMSEDDMPLASVLSPLEYGSGLSSRTRAQYALDFIYRLIKTGLADITWVGDIDRDYEKLFPVLARTPLLDFDSGYWLELQIFCTDKAIIMLNRHHIGWDSPLSISFVEDLEKEFELHDVGVDKGFLVPVTF